MVTPALPSHGPYVSPRGRARVATAFLIAGAVINGLLIIAEIIQLAFPMFRAGDQLADNPGGWFGLVLYSLLAVLRFLVYVGTVIAGFCFGMLGVAVGALTRNTFIAIIALVGFAVNDVDVDRLLLGRSDDHLVVKERVRRERAGVAVPRGLPADPGASAGTAYVRGGTVTTQTQAGPSRTSTPQVAAGAGVTPTTGGGTMRTTPAPPAPAGASTPPPPAAATPAPRSAPPASGSGIVVHSGGGPKH